MFSAKRVSVLSVDDNPLVGEAVERMIAASPDLRHEGHHLDGSAVVRAVSKAQPKVVLMDLEMPGTDTCALVNELRRVAPDTRVLMLSGHLRKHDILQCIEAGAFGYIHKDRSSDYIVQMIRRVAEGEFVLCDEAATAAGLA